VIKDFDEVCSPNGYILDVCATNELRKIYCYSSSENKDYLNILDLDQNLAVTMQKTIPISDTERWVGMDMTTASNILVAAIHSKTNTHDEYLRFVAYSTEESNLDKEYEGLIMKDPEFKNPYFLRKIKGYDIFIVASNGSLIFVGCDGTGVHPFNKISNIYPSKITGLRFKGKTLTPLSSSYQGDLKRIEFDATEFSKSMELEKSTLENSALMMEAIKSRISTSPKVTHIPIKLISNRNELTISWGNEYRYEQ